MARRRRQTSGSWALPLLGLAGLAAIAFWAATSLRAKRPTEAAPTGEQPSPSVERDPFTGEAVVERPEGEDPFGPGPSSDALADRTWVAAVRRAGEAEALYLEAVEAKKQNDRKRMVERGKAALAAFEQALNDTAAFAEDVVRDHGEESSTARRVTGTRRTWRLRTVWLRKSAVR